MTYRETLKHPAIARLSLIQLLSYFGTWFSQVAIFSMLVSFGADSTTIALTAAISMLPAVILAPIMGLAIDRIEFKTLITTLLIIEIVMTAGFIFIESIDFVWVLMMLIFVRSAAASMLFAAEMALFPRLVKGKMLQNTNEIHSIIWSFCYASGMAVGGIATYYFGYDAAFIIDLLLYMVALLLLVGLNISLDKPIHIDTGWEMIRDGFCYLKSQKKILHLLLIHASIGLTSFDTLVTLLADFEYKEFIAVPLAIGIMNATRAIGLMVGPFVIGKIINRDNLHLFFALLGIAVIGWSFFEHYFYVGLVSLFSIGFFVTTLWSYTYLLIQEETDAKYMGRVLSYNEMFFMLSNAITAIFIGYAYKFGLSLQTITATLGFGFICAAAYYIWFINRYSD